MDDVMIDAAAVARCLGISRRMVYDLARDGRLASYRFGDAVRFAPADVEAFRASCRSTGTRPPADGASTLTAASTGNVFGGASYCRPGGPEPKPTLVSCEHPGRQKIKPGQQTCISAELAKRDGWAPGGKWSPSHAAWLMGWPVSWTSLGHSATDKYRQWLRTHGAC